MNVLEEGDLPGFSYSIGLWHNYQHPEVIVLGLKRVVAHYVVNEVGRRVRETELFQHDSVYNGILEGFGCLFLSVDCQHYEEYLGWARWYYEGDSFPVLQCVYPSTLGHFPWHEKSSEWFRKWQPVLGAHPA